MKHPPVSRRVARVGTLAVCLALSLPLSWGPLKAQSELQKGAHLKVRMSQEISTQTAKKGEEFEATLAEDFISDRIVIPKGSVVRGSVVRASRPGRLRGRAELSVHFHRIELPGGETLEISATPVAAEGDVQDPDSEGVIQGPATGKRTATTVATSAGAGAAVGAVVGGKQGSAIGAGIGIIAGIIGSAAEGRKDQVLKKGTILELVLDRSAMVPSSSVKR